MKAKSKRSKIIPILSIATLLSIGITVYSSIILYNSSKSFYIKKEAQNIKKFIKININEWNNLCLLVSNNSNQVIKYMSMALVNGNSSFIYISYFYNDNMFKEMWNEYITKYKSYKLENYLYRLEYDLEHNELIVNSNSKQFSKQLSNIIDDMEFSKVYHEWFFWLNLSIEIIMTVLVIILSLKLYQNLRNKIRNDS